MGGIAQQVRGDKKQLHPIGKSWIQEGAFGDKVVALVPVVIHTEMLYRVMEPGYLFNLRNGGTFLTGLGSMGGAFLCAKVCHLV